MSRNFSDVVTQLLDVIPETEKDLRADLERVLNSARYRPPEHERLSWKEGQEIMARYFGEEPNLDGWSGKALSIWSTKTVDELRAAFKAFKESR